MPISSTDILQAVAELATPKRGCTARDVCSFLGYSTGRATQAAVRSHLEALHESGQVSRSQDVASSGWRWGTVKGEDQEREQGNQG